MSVFRPERLLPQRDLKGRKRFKNFRGGWGAHKLSETAYRLGAADLSSFFCRTEITPKSSRTRAESA